MDTSKLTVLAKNHTKSYICAHQIILMIIGIEELIPFLFVLAVVYGSLEVSKLFKNRGNHPARSAPWGPAIYKNYSGTGQDFTLK